MDRITTWEQIDAHLSRYGFSENSLCDLWGSIDPEQSALGNIVFKIAGDGYNGSFRSDFAKGIIEAQSAFTSYLQYLADTGGAGRGKGFRERCLFRVRISEGCTEAVLETSKPLINAFARRIMTMSEKGVLILSAIIAVAIVSSVIGVTWVINGGEKEQPALTVREDCGLSQKTVNAMFARIDEDSEEKSRLINDLRHAQMMNEQVRGQIFVNTANTSGIEINGTYYAPEDIERIRNDAQKRPEVADVSFVRGHFLVQQVNRLAYPCLKIYLTKADCEFGEEPSVYKSVSIDCADEDLGSDALDAILRAFKEGKPLYLRLKVEYRTDGSVNSASVSAIGDRA